MKTYLHMITAALALLVCFACNEEKDEPAELTPQLTIGGISDNRIAQAALFCQSVSITIQSNCDWKAESDVDWIALTPSEGKAGEFYEASVRFKQRNWSDEKRSGTISISAKDKCVQVFVSQEGFVPGDYGFDDTSRIMDGHPLLMASGKDFAAIRNTAVSTSWLKVIHDYVMRYAEKTLYLQPQAYKLEGTRLLNVSAEALKRLFYLSYAYRFTGDPKFAQRAETELLSINSFQDWHPDHFLDTAEMMMGVAIAYDWCYPRLSETARSAIKEALLEKGLKPYMEIWKGATNNWNQVCNGAAFYASLCVEDQNPELVAQVKERILGMIGAAMSGYSPDGAYIEGPGYWCYGTSYNVLLLDALKRRYGNTCGLLEEYPDFLKTTSYADAVITPSFRAFTYSDQAFPAQVSIVPFFVYDHSGDGKYLYLSSRMLGKGMLNYDHCRHERLIPAAVIFASRRGAPSSEVSSSVELAYIADGQTPVATFRENATDEGASYIGMKLGMPSNGHGHMDIGTFCFESEGVQWATDLGGENYNALESAGVGLWGTEQDSERWTVLRCALSGHNCISFDGQDQIVGAYGRFTEKDPTRKCVTADLSPLYDGQVKEVARTIILDGKDGIVSDHILTDRTAVRMRWNMCTEATGIELGERGARLTSKGGRSMTMTVHGLPSLEMKIWDATPLRSCESRNTQTFVGFEAELTSNSEFDITVKLIPER